MPDFVRKAYEEYDQCHNGCPDKAGCSLMDEFALMLLRNYRQKVTRERIVRRETTKTETME